MIITVRDVNEKAFRQLRTEAVSRGLKTGVAASEAFMQWASKEKPGKRKGKSLFDLKPIDWGEGSEFYSSRFDEYLYGGKK